MVLKKGIEPLFPVYHTGVLPLNYKSRIDYWVGSPAVN